MGQNKLLMPWGETTVLGQVVKTLAQAGVPETIVVIGHEAEAIRESVQDLPCRTYMNLRYPEGMGRSIAAGVQACLPQTEGFLIVPGDMPALSQELVSEILERASENGLVVPRFGVRLGQPVYFGRVCRSELEALSGESGARNILEAHRDHIQFIDVEDERVFDDIDTIEDYRRQRDSTAAD